MTKYECRFCLEESPVKKLISPCQCDGSVKYVHKQCLEKWRQQNTDNQYYHKCNLCGGEYTFSPNIYDYLNYYSCFYLFIYYVLSNIIAVCLYNFNVSEKIIHLTIRKDYISTVEKFLYYDVTLYFYNLYISFYFIDSFFYFFTVIYNKMYNIIGIDHCRNVIYLIYFQRYLIAWISFFGDPNFLMIINFLLSASYFVFFGLYISNFTNVNPIPYLTINHESVLNPR